MANWTTEQQPFGQNRAPALSALASDGSGVIPLAADKTTGRLLVNATGSSGGTSSTFGAAFPTTGTAVGATDGTNMQPLNVDGSGNLKVNVVTGGSSGTQYTDGGVPPAHPIGTMPIYNNGGTWSQVSTTNGLPVQGIGTFTISGTVSGNKTPADGYANPTDAVDSIALNSVYNGTTWDRARGVVAANGTAGTGLLGAGMVGQYNSTAPTVGNGNYNVAQLTSRGSLAITPFSLNSGAFINYLPDNADGVAVDTNSDMAPAISRNTVFNGTSWDRARSIAIGDTAASTGIPAVGLMAYNGSTYDRLHEFFLTSDNSSVQTGLYTLPQTLIYNGTNWDRERGANAAAGTTGTGLLGVGNLGFDGTNWQYAGIDANHNLKVTIANNISPLPDNTNITSVGGSEVATVAPGVQLIAQAGPTGDPLGTTGNALNVAVNPGVLLGAGVTTSGTQTYFNSALKSSTPVKFGALNLYGYHIYNPNSNVIYVQFFNNGNTGLINLTAVTPQMILVVPPGGWVDSAPGGGVPISFTQGLAIVATQTLIGTLATTGLVVNLWYA